MCYKAPSLARPFRLNQRLDLKKFIVLIHIAFMSTSERLRQQVTVMERDLQIGKKQAEFDKREIENLKREKDILNKNMQKIQSKNRTMHSLKILSLYTYLHRLINIT